MFELKPELREGETVFGEYGATVYQVRGKISSAGSNIRLFLTNQRLILKAGIGPQRTLPIYAITRDGKRAVSLDFDRVHSTRPGYGYHLTQSSYQNHFGRRTYRSAYSWMCARVHRSHGYSYRRHLVLFASSLTYPMIGRERT